MRKKTNLYLKTVSVCLIISAFLLASCDEKADIAVNTTESETQDIFITTDIHGDKGDGTLTSDYNSHGVFTSDTGTSLSLEVNWECAMADDGRYADLCLWVRLVFEGELTNGETVHNKLEINGKEHNFAVEPLENYPASPLLIFAYEEKIPRDYSEVMGIGISASYAYNGYYDGYYINELTAGGIIIVTDDYSKMPEKAECEVELIRQYPELPNGCEVTSLAMALRYVGYDIEKLALKNDYLPIGAKDFYKYNIGDPATEQSYGCYSPVIAEMAKKYIADNGNGHRVTDLTHYCPEELYYRVSCGTPVIVWVTLRLVPPSILASWSENGKEYRWKDPEHCVLLTGYDMKEKTVTLTDPIYGNTVCDMADFEKRFHQMGEQAVIIE